MKVSVVIPFTRPKLVLLVVKSVLDQDKDGILEIIVVGKDSSLLKEKLDRKVKIIDQGLILGPGQARNIGAKKASGQVLIFLDDDCLPQKQWLLENINIINQDEVGAVGGMIKGRSKRYFAKSLDFANFTYAQSTKPREMPICAASLVIKKEIFQKVGGFNEKLKVGEDTDLCMRLKRAGFKTIYNPRIEILHDHNRQTLKDLLIYQYNNGRIKGLIIENKYPDNFWFAFLKKISHPLVYWSFILPFSVLATFVTILINLKDHPLVIFYGPGIFIGKLACQLGIFVWTLRKPFILA